MFKVFPSILGIYCSLLKLLDFRYRFLRPWPFKKFAIESTISPALKDHGHKNQLAKKPVDSHCIFGVNRLQLRISSPYWAGAHLQEMLLLSFYYNSRNILLQPGDENNEQRQSGHVNTACFLPISGDSICL